MIKVIFNVGINHPLNNKVVEDDTPKYFTAEIFDVHTRKKILTSEETTPYYEGEIFCPLGEEDYECVFTSKIENEKQIVIAMKIYKK